jgi:hypothetical protein
MSGQVLGWMARLVLLIRFPPRWLMHVDDLEPGPLTVSDCRRAAGICLVARQRDVLLSPLAISSPFAVTRDGCCPLCDLLSSSSPRGHQPP